MSAGYPAHTIWQVEQNEFCRAVLARHWPHSQRFDDVTTLDASSIPTPDIVCGGFPCQDISTAGTKEGLQGERSGLFYEMARIVRQIRPRVWVMENVPEVVNRGLPDILAEVALLGYAARWGSLRASAVGAPHRRERWFCVCWLADHDRQRGDPSAWLATGERADLSDPDWRSRSSTSDSKTMGDSDDGRLSLRRTKPEHLVGRSNGSQTRGQWSPAPRMGRDADGFPDWLDGHRWPAPPGPHQHPYEPPRTRQRHRHDRERLKALGNAVVPQQAAVIGRWIGEQLLH